MNGEMISAMKQIEKERQIPIEVLLEAIESALLSAYKRNFGATQNVAVQIDRQTGGVRVLARKTVVSTVKDAQVEISLAEAKAMEPTVKKGEILEFEITPQDFGRIAAQTAKQVIVQRIREAERDIIFTEYSARQGDIVSGVVQRYEQRNILVDLGRAEAVLPQSEQVPYENFRHGDRIKAYVLEVKKTTRGPQVVISRTHPNLIKRLFELEVPEIRQGVIEIKALVREPGHRSKIAVKSKDSNVDAVGACVGPKGSRVQTVVDELRGEKIDIINWNEDLVTYISNSLSPAKVVTVTVYDYDKSALVMVPDHQLSLAIGKEGQNVRLAAKITGWKIDIKSETQVKESPPEPPPMPVVEEAAEEVVEVEEEVEAEETAEVQSEEAVEEVVAEETVEVSQEELIVPAPEAVDASEEKKKEGKKKKDAFIEEKGFKKKRVMKEKIRKHGEYEDYEDYSKLEDV